MPRVFPSVDPWTDKKSTVKFHGCTETHGYGFHAIVDRFK